jgi:hypothetical protein
MVDCAALAAAHLTRLYGVAYSEGIVGGRRFMAAD